MCRLLMTLAAALVLAVGLAGCTSTAATTSTPCASCKWGAKNTQGPMNDPVKYCVYGGKQVDCTKTPPECPECAKAQQGK